MRHAATLYPCGIMLAVPRDSRCTGLGITPSSVIATNLCAYIYLALASYHNMVPGAQP